MTMTQEVKRTRTLVLGAGELGLAVLTELARHRDADRGARPAVLLRPGRGRRDDLENLDVEVVEADLASASVDDLAAIFAGFSQVICCTGFVGGPGTQRRITQAVLQAEVDHYIPWQFGVDYDVVGRGSGQPVWDEQLDVRDMLRGQDRVRWTIISTGIFTSFVFLPEFGIVDLAGRRVAALGSWDHRLTATAPEDIGRMTAVVVADPDAYASQVVHVAGDTFTYHDLADTVDRVLGVQVARTLLTAETLLAEAEHRPQDIMAAYRLAFARPDGVAWPLAETLNARLGMAMIDTATWLRRWRDFEGTADPDDAGVVGDDIALRMAVPEELIASPGDEAAHLVEVARRFYGGWNASAPALLDNMVAPGYIDRTPPPGRAPDKAGLTGAWSTYRTAFPDGRVHVLQQLVVGDRVVSHLRMTGRWTGIRDGIQGRGQRIDYLATDIVRVAKGLIVEDWHVDDREALARQLG